MKIAVSAAEKNLDALLDPLFGRCACFIIVDTVDMSFEAYENPNVAVQEEAGIRSARLVASKGAEVVMTGHCGPNAFNTLTAAGIKVITGVNGTVRDAVRNYKAGKYAAADQPDARPHAGMGGK